MTVRTFLATVLAVTAVGCGTPQATPLLGGTQLTSILGKGLAQAGKFKLATYNVENLFDGSNVDLDGKFSKAKPDHAKQALAKSFHDLNADVIGLVEVESKATLRNFRDHYLASMGYTHMALVEGNDPRGIDVGVLSRYPITHVRSNKTQPINVPGYSTPQRFSRDVLEARIQPNSGYSFTLYTAHLKARPGEPTSDAKRHAEAKTVREMFRKVVKNQPNANFALIGDFNDRPDSETVAILKGKRDRDAQLYDTLGELGPNAYTYHPIRYRGRIDYIMLSEGMRREYVPQSAQVLNTPDALKASDHLPAVVTIDASADR